MKGFHKRNKHLIRQTHDLSFQIERINKKNK